MENKTHTCDNYFTNGLSRQTTHGMTGSKSTILMGVLLISRITRNQGINVKPTAFLEVNVIFIKSTE